MQRLFLVRHAESVANIGGRTSDPATIPLSARGHVQAEEVALRFMEKPSLVVTSRYIRTKQTAAPTIKRFDITKHEEWDVHEFTYLSPMRCQNTTETDREPMVRQYWNRCDPYYCDGEGAESFAEFVGRIQRTLEHLRSREDALIALFSHQQFIAALLWVMQNNITALSHQSMNEFKGHLGAHAIVNGSSIEVSL